MEKNKTAPGADRGGEEVLCSNTTSYAKPNTQLQELPGGYVPGKGKIEKLFVDRIEVRADHRAVDQEVVKALAESMRRVGLLSPILVRVSANENNDSDILISGRHRLEAAKLLGWDFIDGYGLCIGDAAARVREISENLHRAELSKLDRAKQTSELIVLYSSLDEEEKKLAQVAQVSKGGRGKRGGKSETARLMSIPRREIERAEKIASIIPEAQEAAKAAGIDDNQSKLLEVAAASPEQQVQAVKSVTRRRKVKPGQRVFNSPQEAHADDEGGFDPVPDSEKSDEQAFLLRADYAFKFAIYTGPKTRRVIETASATASVWNDLVRKLEQEK